MENNTKSFQELRNELDKHTNMLNKNLDKLKAEREKLEQISTNIEKYLKWS